VINSVEGRTVVSAGALTQLLVPYRPADEVSIGWTTSLGQTQSAHVHLTSGPPA